MSTKVQEELVEMFQDVYKMYMQFTHPFEHNGQWYFFANVPSELRGPFDSDTQAWQAFRRFHAWQAAMDVN